MIVSTSSGAILGIAVLAVREGAEAWRGDEVGYTDVLSIENEDWMQDKIEGVSEHCPSR